MKNKLLFLLVLSFISLDASERMIDEPALTAGEKTFKAAVQAYFAYKLFHLSANVGGPLGYVLGSDLIRKKLPESLTKTEWVPYGMIMYQRADLRNRPKSKSQALVLQRKAPLIIAIPGYSPESIATIVGAATVGMPAGVIGMKFGNFLANNFLARWHGVSHTIEKISQYYNINIAQYGPMLMAAKDRLYRKKLHNQINEIFSKRFGNDWKKKIVILFDKYQDTVSDILKKKIVDRSLDEKDFIRMVELGAAMANLYFDSKPSKKNMLKDAIKFYQELDFLE